MAFDSQLEKRASSEKKIAAKLADTRKIIQNKFKTAKKKRVDRDRKLGERYRPITSAIEKLSDKQVLKATSTKNDDDDDDDVSMDELGGEDYIWDYEQPYTEPDDSMEGLSGQQIDFSRSMTPTSSSGAQFRKRAPEDVENLIEGAILEAKRPHSIDKIMQKQQLVRLGILKKRQAKIREMRRAVRKPAVRNKRRRDDDSPAIDPYIIISSDEENDIATLVSPNNDKRRKMVRSAVKGHKRFITKMDAIRGRRRSGHDRKSREYMTKNTRNIHPSTPIDPHEAPLISSIHNKRLRGGESDAQITLNIPSDNEDDVLALVSPNSAKRRKLVRSSIKDYDKFVAKLAVARKRRKRSKNDRNAREYVPKKQNIRMVRPSTSRNLLAEAESIPLPNTSDEESDESVYTLTDASDDSSLDDEPIAGPQHVNNRLDIVHSTPYVDIIRPTRPKISSDRRFLYKNFVPPTPNSVGPIEVSRKSGKKAGKGIESNFIPLSNGIVHEFYDDPNELCDRLRLLIASRSAGNTNHAQEINSIISELRESGYIE